MAEIKSFVDKAVSEVPVVGDFWDAGKFFARLFGALPRGDFQKFQRTIYPVMAQHATNTGVAVYAFWFGDLIRVGPGGVWGSIGPKTSLAEALEKLKDQLQTEGVAFTLQCQTKTDWNDPNSIASTCHFQREQLSIAGRVISTVTEILTPGDPMMRVGDPDLQDTEKTGSPFGDIPFFGASLAPNLGTLLIIGTIVGLVLVFRKGK